ncbi:40S ribosomal protein S15a [Astathelohania contejeani]|uniref:40S ribosomal protein S15a n=1 Tax=Astathelohania contejeani TaxID=164912 RepID=A0ABQ7HZJ1_9MICR|nr:40S ribosomal protein S15a [Thelohania contejeani]
MDKLTAACKTISTASRQAKRQVLLRCVDRTTKAFLEMMQKKGYVTDITYIHDNRKGKAVIGLNGRLNKCGTICPRFNVKCEQIEKFRDRILPARQFGHLLLTTSSGVLDHNECISKKVGGKVLGFFY